MRTAILRADTLGQFLTREIRRNVVDTIKESIAANGFLMERLLTVVGNDVVDGNHRLVAALESGVT